MKALLGSKFDVRSFEAKNWVFEFNHQQMNTFEFVRCSKTDVRVRSMFDKMVFDPSLLRDTVFSTLEVLLFKILLHKRANFCWHPFGELAINGRVFRKRCERHL